MQEASAPSHFKRPGWFTKNVFNRIVALFTRLGILSKEELESRFHVRLERYIKERPEQWTVFQPVWDTNG